MGQSNLYQKIYEIVADIPAGQVATYGQIAWMVGIPNAPRVIGYAMSKVPLGLNIPCHRVVNKAGAMAPNHVFGGGQNQRDLLEQEGITFLLNGCIDMEKCQWRFYVSEEDME